MFKSIFYANFKAWPIYNVLLRPRFLRMNYWELLPIDPKLAQETIAMTKSNIVLSHPPLRCFLSTKPLFIHLKLQSKFRTPNYLPITRNIWLSDILVFGKRIVLPFENRTFCLVLGGQLKPGQNCLIFGPFVWKLNCMSYF